MKKALKIAAHILDAANSFITGYRLQQLQQQVDTLEQRLDEHIAPSAIREQNLRTLREHATNPLPPYTRPPSWKDQW